jgi:argininosuccinate synthase
VCFLANVGQDEPWDEVEKKALKIGALKMVRCSSRTLSPVIGS